ncbi:MAG: type 4a pilus biogenesis protein PilO [Gaiellaceae bacterium]
MSPAPNIKKTPVAIRLVVVVGGLIVLALAGYFLLIVPKKNETKSLDQQIVQLDQQISAQRAEATQAAGLSKILVADFNKLQSAMPDQAKMDELYQQLVMLAGNTGISFDNYQPGTVIDASAYQVLPVTVTFQGSFDELSDFLYRLQSLVLVDNHKLSATGRLFTVDQVSFAEGEGGFPRIQATLQIDAYAFGHPVVTAANAASSSTSTDTTSTSTTSTTGTTTPSSEGTTTSATSGG